MKALIMTVISLLLATAATAAPIQENVGIGEGQCEVVNAGQYYCKVNGKCYYCTKNKDVNPGTDCYKETQCTLATEITNTMAPPMRATRMVREAERLQLVWAESKGK